MIRMITETGNEEMDILAELMVDSAGNKRKRRIGRILCIFAIMLLGIATVNEFREGVMEGPWMLYLILMIVFFLFFLFCRRYQRMRLKSYYRKEIANTEKGLLQREYVITDEEIRIHARGVESKIQWDAIRKNRSMSHYWILETVQGNWLIIDRNQLDQPEQLQLEQWLMEKVPV